MLVLLATLSSILENNLMISIQIFQIYIISIVMNWFIIGKMLAKLPVETSIGKMLVLAAMMDVLEPILTIAACLTVRLHFVQF